MSEYRLEVRGVTKVFPGTRALDQVQLQVRPGEVHALCGENGAGKSTLMNIIGGVFPPTEGEILFEGAPIAPRSPKEAQDIGIGEEARHRGFQLVLCSSGIEPVPPPDGGGEYLHRASAPQGGND